MLKRCFDIFFALLTLLLLSPLILVIALAVRVTIGNPIIYAQTRPGLFGNPFRLLKFRSMSDLHDRSGNLLPDKKRLTRIGQFLRKTSLDELPQLFNVLKGEMSIVGPRPLLMKYLDRYDQTQRRRHNVKPGITGWAQVNGRNGISWKDRFELDVWYVDHGSLLLDLKIVLLTIWKILLMEGISQQGSDTTSEFLGSRQT